MNRILLILFLLTNTQLVIKAQTGKFTIVTHQDDNGNWKLHPKKSILLAYGSEKFEYKTTAGVINTFFVTSYKDFKIKTSKGKRKGFYYKVWWIDEDAEKRNGYLKIIPQDKGKPYQLIVGDYIEEDMLLGFYKTFP